MNPTIVEEEPISIYELKTEMGRIKRRDEELNIRGGKVEEYINNYAVLSQKDAKALEKDLEDLEVPRLKDYHIKKIVDLLPKSLEEIKVILSGYTLTVTKEYRKKIIDTVKKYV